MRPLHFLRPLLVSLFCFVAVQAHAITLIRDAEIERALSELGKPILTAAGLSSSRVRILVINDDSLNAFVIDDRHIFMHSGLLLRMESAAQVQAVIAHEAAHIANGHITRRMADLRRSGNFTSLGVALAAVVGATTGNGQAAAGLAAGAAGSSKRSFFALSRAQEASADQAAARYMARAKIDPMASVEVLNLFRGQEALSIGRQDPYVRTHPLTTDRLRVAKGFASAYGDKAIEHKQSDYWFARAHGKLSAFIRAPSWTLRRVKNDNSATGLMRRAVAYHQRPDPKNAVKTINQLIKARPKDPYYRELRGQIYLESRQFKNAVSAYGEAVNLAPNQPLILSGYGAALLAVGDQASVKKAISVLEKARSRDGADSRSLRNLAVAYAKVGQNGKASLLTAERYMLRGDVKTAGTHAKRASGLLQRGTPSWQRAQDILRASGSK